AYTVSRRLNGLRHPGILPIPFEGKGPDYKQIVERDGKRTMGFKEWAPLAPESSRWGGFLSGSATRLDLEDTSAADGYGITTYGVTLGIDYRVSDTLTLGVLFGYANSEADLHGGDISENAGTLGLYGSW